MQADVDAYFATCSDDNPPLISGLAYALDMTTECFRNYGTDDQFSATVKKAKQRVEMSYEKRLSSTAPTGSIFWLKCNSRWQDKQEIELTGKDGGPLEMLLREISGNTLGPKG